MFGVSENKNAKNASLKVRVLSFKSCFTINAY